jgi:hypothetical protein
MDLQLHDGGNYTMPRRRFTTAGQIMKNAYGTPTYFQFLEEMGLSGEEDDNTLEENFDNFLSQQRDIFGNIVQGYGVVQDAIRIIRPKKPKPVVMGPAPAPILPTTPAAPLVMLPTPAAPVNPNKQVAIDAAKAAGSALIQQYGSSAPTAEKLFNVGTAAISAVPIIGPAANLIMGALPNLFQSKPGPRSYEELKQYVEKFKYSKNPLYIQGVALARQNIANMEAQAAAQQPIVAAEPTNIPMVGKTAAGLAPIMPQLEPAKPSFGGLSTTNLILLGLGGFLAFKLLNK